MAQGIFIIIQVSGKWTKLTDQFSVWNSLPQGSDKASVNRDTLYWQNYQLHRLLHCSLQYPKSPKLLLREQPGWYMVHPSPLLTSICKFRSALFAKYIYFLSDLLFVNDNFSSFYNLADTHVMIPTRNKLDWTYSRRGVNHLLQYSKWLCVSRCPAFH